MNHTHWTQQYYAQAWPGTARPFWQEHGGSYLPENYIPTSFTQKLSSALLEEKLVTPPTPEKAIDINFVLQQLWNGKPTVSPAISYVPSSCVVNDCLEMKTAIRHPNLPGTMAFLETMEIYPLLEMAAHTPTFGSLVTAWSQLMPFNKAAKMAVYLWDKQVLLPQ